MRRRSGLLRWATSVDPAVCAILPVQIVQRRNDWIQQVNASDPASGCDESTPEKHPSSLRRRSSSDDLLTRSVQMCKLRTCATRIFMAPNVTRTVAQVFDQRTEKLDATTTNVPLPAARRHGVTYSWWESRGGGQGDAQAGRGFGQARLFSTGSFRETLMT